MSSVLKKAFLNSPTVTQCTNYLPTTILANGLFPYCSHCIPRLLCVYPGAATRSLKVTVPMPSLRCNHIGSLSFQAKKGSELEDKTRLAAGSHFPVCKSRTIGPMVLVKRRVLIMALWPCWMVDLFDPLSEDLRNEIMHAPGAESTSS